MDQRVQQLREQLAAFNERVIRFVENCSDEAWMKRCDEEDWAVGVVARHIGAGHYGIVDLARNIIAGQALPDLTSEQIVEMANAHAREHANCTREEVLAVLREQGAKALAFVAELKDGDLDRKGHMKVFGGEFTVQQLIERVIMRSAAGHLASMQAATQA
jgi:uncharacterized damage-inducible protein DinB